MRKRLSLLGLSSLPLLAALSCSGGGDTSKNKPIFSAVQAPPQVRSRSNSLVRLPHDAYFADVDGDGIAELVTANSNQLFVNRIDQAGSGFGHHYFDQNIRELAVGHFSGAPRQEVCAFLENDWFECIRWVSDQMGFEVWLSTGGAHPTSPAIATPTTAERMIVGDFNGDGKDDLMLHKPSNGAVRFLSVRTDLGCDPELGCGPVFALMSYRNGDLDRMPDLNFPLRNKEIYAGEFGGSAGHDDLLVVDRATGIVYRLESTQMTIQTSMTPIIFEDVTTFHLANTTASGQIASAEVLAIGNVDGEATDALVAFATDSGVTRFLKADSGATLRDVPMLPSQLAGSTAPGSRPFLGKMSLWAGEPGTDVREDILFYDAGIEQYVRSDARWSDGNTYWWAYNQVIRRFDLEFGRLGPNQLWLILLCTDQDVPAQPWFNTAAYAPLYEKPGRNTPNLYNFFKDMSYGTANYSAEVRGVYPLGTPQAIRGREQTWNECATAAGIQGDWTTSFYRIVVVTNGVDDFGYGPGLRVTLDTRSSTEIYVPGQEMGHSLNLPHAFGAGFASSCGGGGPGEYCDATDPMGGGVGVYSYGFGATHIRDGGNGFSVSAAYGAATRLIGGWVPPSRQANLVSGFTGATQTIQLAALDRPESPGYLVATIQPTSDPSDTYLVELRSKTGRWDSALPVDGVLIRHFTYNSDWRQNVGYVEGQSTAAFRQPGDSFTADGIAVRVLGLDSTNGTASVEITY